MFHVNFLLLIRLIQHFSFDLMRFDGIRIIPRSATTYGVVQLFVEGISASDRYDTKSHNYRWIIELQGKLRQSK